ncbi:hypothetical protein SLEP1_g4718 [Rubroshorea leprosula]|uniref:Uncharacterized protein n=1 Tax=Rubroshorea leprosula TaxID=152421 RepID=A0AAV5HYI3_9ROSI|nr:hypothetical protein SLEP1_g4718 [Rubroshorea leprosula]
MKFNVLQRRIVSILLCVFAPGEEGEGLGVREDRLSLVDVDNGGFESVVRLREVKDGRGVVGSAGSRHPWTVAGANKGREFKGGEGDGEGEVEGKEGSGGCGDRLETGWRPGE